MTLDQAQRVSTLLMVGTLSVVAWAWIKWDLWVYRRFGHRATLSHVIWQSTQDHPYWWLLIFQSLSFWAWHLFIGKDLP